MSAKLPIDIKAFMERVRGGRRLPFAIDGTKLESYPLYALGTALDFGAGGNAEPYTLSGWSHPEPGYRWTVGASAELCFAFSQPPGDLILSFKAKPHLGGKVEAQKISASWNGMLVGEWLVGKTHSYHALIFLPKTAGSMTGLLQFHLPLAFVPLSMNPADDPRRLGLAFFDLVLRSTLDFGL